MPRSIARRSQKEAELATINATVAKLEAVLPVLQQRVDIKKTLFSHETGSKASYLEILQSLVETQQDLLVQKSKSEEAEAALAAIIEQQAQTAAEFRRTLSGEIVEAQRKVGGLSEDLIKAEQRTKLQLLTAPVDGAVQQLAVHTIGGVVTPAQALMVVVPADSHLEIEAMVSNRDIGFVRVGQDVEIKVDTFNFTRYGLIHGNVLSVSQDAITRDKPQDKNNNDQTAGATTELKRAQGPGARLRGAHLARPHPDEGRGEHGQSLSRHGGHGRDQDRRALGPLLPPVAAAALQAGELAGAVRHRLPAIRRFLKFKSRSDHSIGALPLYLPTVNSARPLIGGSERQYFA